MIEQAVPMYSKTSDVPNDRFRQRRRSFTEALREKYCTDENWDTENFSIKIVLHGTRRNKDGAGPELESLTNVCLDNGSISHAGFPNGGLVSLCPNVVDLDLASNLIESWGEILPILSELHHLKFVNLARNPFKDAKILQNWNQDLPSIENLVLNNTGVTWDDVTHLAQFIPHLKELHVCKNGYSKLTEERLTVFQNLECLRLNENRITRWEEVWKLHSLPKLSFLILSGNPLLEIFYQEQVLLNAAGSTSQHEGTSSHESCIPGMETDGRNRRTTSESSVSSIENELRDIELNFDDSTDDDDTIENEDESGDQSLNYLDDSNITEQCNSFVEDVMLKVIGKMLESDQVEAQGQGQGHSMGEGHCEGQGYEKTGAQDLNEMRQSSETDNLEKDQNKKQENLPWSSNHNNSTTLAMNDVTMVTVPFQELRVLCVSETLLSQWSDLEALAKFPKLQKLRVKDVSLLCHVPMEERRKLFLACLPKITSLNGSDVTENERDKAERHFVRYFTNIKHKPARHAELVEKHGKLKPLREFDIGFGFQEWATLGFIYKGIRVHEESIHVVQPIGKLRQFISQKFSLPMKSFRMLHYPCGQGHKGHDPDLDELLLDSLPMSRYDFMDGDEIHIDDTSAPKKPKI